ncbi:hypothetical protein [Alteromonas sp. S167]|uniref:hypothetical protein n=1 Tax=Alteromonas sp. S167 TaxID=3117402 RepID=UPI002FE38103
MAIREVRLNFFGNENIRELNGTIGQPFTWFMDGVMRGRFKSYSGIEVKGINIVNCNFREAGFKCSDTWETLLNTHQIELPFVPKMFVGEQVTQVITGIKYFCEIAKNSPLPQVKLISEHALESLTDQKILEAIEKADEYYAYMLEQHRQGT